MSDRPTLAADLLRQQVSENGAVTWPESPPGQTAIARALLGQQLVGAMDHWIEHALDLLDHEKPADGLPRRSTPHYKQEAYFRDRLARLSAEQKLTLRHLIRTLAHGMLFSFLATLDQGDYGDFRLALKPKVSPDNVTSVPITPTKTVDLDLHDELNDWTLSFSRFADEILDLVETKHGWQFQPKDFASP